VKILGIDPGIHGGLAVVSVENETAPVLVDAIDIPAIGVGAKERVDALAIRGWIQSHQPAHAVIERAQVLPKQGSSSGFKYGRAVGAIEAAIALCAIPLTIIEPTAWKKFHNLRGGEKEPSRQRALMHRRAQFARSQERPWQGRSGANCPLWSALSEEFDDDDSRSGRLATSGAFSPPKGNGEIEDCDRIRSAGSSGSVVLPTS
jgi:crossover junction endodeoxyribonuclease RuvC